MNTNLLDFTGKRILVTGAASGIGKATALLLSQLGADLILADLNMEGLEALRPIIRKTDYLMQVDLSDTVQLIAKVENAVKEVGPIDGMALVAGMLYAVPLKFVKEETWEKIEKVNLYSTIELAKIYTKKGIKTTGKGAIVTVSSYCGQVGTASSVCYSATKAGLIGVTKALAIELAPKGIRVNSVSPGTVMTEMVKKDAYGADEEYVNNLEALHPLGLGTPNDIANAIVFLLSDMSKWMTGAIVNVDGGYTAK